MKKVIIATIVALIMFVGIAGASEPIKLKFALMDPATSFPVVKAYKPWIEIINRASEGTLKMEMYPGGTLGHDPRVQLKLVMDGVADIGFIVPSYTPGRFPEDEVFDIPFLAENGVESALASQRMFEKGLLSGYENVVVLGHYTTGVYYLHTDFPVRLPEDVKGHKFRATNKFQADMFKKLGAVSVGMPIPKTAENISRGVINGTICDMTALNAFRIVDAAKHHLMVPFGGTALAVVMNKDKYLSLSPKAKAAIDKHGADIVKMWSTVVDEDANNNIKAMKSGTEHTVVVPTEAELNQWETAIAPVIDDWKSKNPTRGELIKVYKEEIAKIRSNQ